MKLALIFISLLLVPSWACQNQEEKVEKKRVVQQPANVEAADGNSNTEETDLSKIGDEDDQKDVNTGYQITLTKPSEVCGQAGFEYLSKGYLFKECGTCHFKNNQFGVTEFSDRTDLASSYDVMLRLVDKEFFMEAVHVNAFCSKCLLKDGDPLIDDLQYFVERLTDESCESAPVP